MHEWDKRIDNIFSKDDIHHHFFNHIGFCVFSMDGDGLIHDVNQTFLDKFGYKRDQVIGKSWSQFVHPDDRDKSFDISNKNLPNKKFLENIGYFENRWKKSSGEYLVLRWHEGDALFFENYYICYAKIWEK